MAVLRAAFFDMGSTLIQGPQGQNLWHPVVMERIARAFGSRDWAEELYRTDLRRPPPDDPYRQETNRWMADWFRERGETFSDDEVERLRCAFAAPIPAGYSLARGAAEAVRWCKDRGLVVAVLTNTISRGDIEVRSDCDRFGLLIDYVVSSYSTGWAKPHRAMFERALGLTGIAPAEAVMIGDEYLPDVVGAKRVGVRAVWRSAHGVPPAQFAERPDAVIASLEQLPSVLETWCGPS